jgi:glycerophosphoryl diester phosphodiesterase
MASFRGTVEVGADAIETDLRLSKDGVVVLSHVRNEIRAHLFSLQSRETYRAKCYNRMPISSGALASPTRSPTATGPTWRSCAH